MRTTPELMHLSLARELQSKHTQSVEFTAGAGRDADIDRALLKKAIRDVAASRVALATDSKLHRVAGSSSPDRIVYGLTRVHSLRCQIKAVSPESAHSQSSYDTALDVLNARIDQQYNDLAGAWPTLFTPNLSQASFEFLYNANTGTYLKL